MVGRCARGWTIEVRLLSTLELHRLSRCSQQWGPFSLETIATAACLALQVLSAIFLSMNSAPQLAFAQLAKPVFLKQRGKIISWMLLLAGTSLASVEAGGSSD